jgi:hypothetical protein
LGCDGKLQLFWGDFRALIIREIIENANMASFCGFVVFPANSNFHGIYGDGLSSRD